MSPVMKRSLWLLALGCLFYGMSARGQAPSPTGSVPTNLWMRLDGLDLGEYQPTRTPVSGSLMTSNGVMYIYQSSTWKEIATVEAIILGISPWDTTAYGITYTNGSVVISSGNFTNVGNVVVLGSVDGGAATFDNITLNDGTDGDVTASGTIAGMVGSTTLSTNRTWTNLEMDGRMVYVDTASTQTLSNVNYPGRSIGFHALGDVVITIDIDAADHVTDTGVTADDGEDYLSDGSSGTQVMLHAQSTSNLVVVGKQGEWAEATP